MLAILVKFVLLIVFVMLVWLVESGLATTLGRNAGARVSGALFSMSASGTIGKAVTYGTWKGRQWARVWFKPENPNTEKQVNVRTAMRLMVIKWQEFNDPQLLAWNTYAEQFAMSGFNKFVSKGMVAYVAQLTTSVTPVSFGISNVPPNETFTWSDGS